jgi:hypothetical protein
LEVGCQELADGIWRALAADPAVTS